MIDVSDEASALLRTAHTAVHRATLTIEGTAAYEFDLLPDTRYDLDSSADVVATGSVSLVDESGALTIGDAKDLLSPFGAEMILKKGVKLADGTEELAQVGVFRLPQASINNSAEGVRISAQMYDRASLLQDPTGTLTLINAGTTPDEAIRTIVNKVAPWIEVEDATGLDGVTTGALIVETPWTAINFIGTTAGIYPSFGPDGRLTLRPIRTLGPPDIVLDSSQPDTVLISLEKTTTTIDIPSGILVEGESIAGTPIRVLVWDDDPTSPTYYLGNYGKRVRRISSEHVRLASQAEILGRAELDKAKSRTEQLSAEIVPNPFLRPDDVALVRDEATGVDGLYFIDRIGGSCDVRNTMSLSLVRATAKESTSLQDLADA